MALSGGRMGGRFFPAKGRKWSNSSTTSSSCGGWGGGGNPIFGGCRRSCGGGGDGDVEFIVGCMCLMLMFFVVICCVLGYSSNGSWDATEKISVVKFQVGLLGLGGRSLQSKLNRIAEGADLSTREGMSYVLTETTLALLRHPEYCISVYSSVDMKRSMEDGERRFDQLSFEERMKFDEETLVNVNNIKMQRTTSQRASGFGNEYIVITILVAAEGVHKLPTINSRAVLKVVLKRLGSIPSSKALAVEVLWTPQNENSTLSKRELHKNYPLLEPL